MPPRFHSCWFTTWGTEMIGSSATHGISWVAHCTTMRRGGEFVGLAEVTWVPLLYLLSSGLQVLCHCKWGLELCSHVWRNRTHGLLPFPVGNSEAGRSESCSHCEVLLSGSLGLRLCFPLGFQALTLLLLCFHFLCPYHTLSDVEICGVSWHPGMLGRGTFAIYICGTRYSGVELAYNSLFPSPGYGIRWKGPTEMRQQCRTTR